MLEVILVPFLLDNVTPQFPSGSVGELLKCSEAEQLISNLEEGRSEYKQELIETIKLSTKPECYEGSERNS